MRHSGGRRRAAYALVSLIAAHGLLTCPHCAQPLEVAERTARCSSGHTFDAARQGYLNLLGAAQPRHADTADMVAARERFLTSGTYEPIADAVATELRGARTILEVGAGTGYYLTHALGEHARGIALDISVAAARRAARSDSRIAAIVADVWHRLPVLSGVMDAVLCVFAPRNLAEFARVLTPGGRLVVVTPTPAHLASLRESYHLLDVADDKDDRLLASADGLFGQVSVRDLGYTASVTAHQVRDLIGMGPNAFHEVPQNVADTTIEVAVRVWTFIRS